MNAIDPPPTLPELLDHTAALHPERTAYIEGDRRLTWGEMAALSCNAAAALFDLGLRPGDRVAICAENSIDWLLACYAALRAGCIATLVYYDLRPDEIRRQVEWTGCRFLFASPVVMEALGQPPAGIERTFLLGPPAATLTAGQTHFTDLTGPTDASFEAPDPQPGDTAVVIYTSGTTGGAKGVMLSHRNLISDSAAACQAFSFSETDSTLLVLPLHHALPFLAVAVVVPLAGAHVVIENDLRRIRDRLQQHRPTIFFGVPALYELIFRNVLARADAEGRLKTLQRLRGLVRHVKRLTGVNLGPLVFRQVHKALGGRLRFLVSGGAALNPQTARDFFSLGLPLLQGWGMTEAGPAIALQRFSARRFRFTRYYESHAGSVGPPLPGVEVELIDVPEKDIRVAEQGEGEVIVRGPNVFSGYWNAPEQTDAVLVDGWLHTGDMGRIAKDGSIFLTGRSKYVIVLDSGEKVHPDELESEMQATSDLLADACVLDRQLRERAAVTAVIYPNLDSARKRCAAARTDLTEATLRGLIDDDIARVNGRIAAYKRIGNLELSDQPLPKTALRKVARAQIADAYDFDFERWLASETDLTR